MGYVLAFQVYTGAEAETSKKGLGYRVTYNGSHKALYMRERTICFTWTIFIPVQLHWLICCKRVCTAQKLFGPTEMDSPSLS